MRDKLIKRTRKIVSVFSFFIVLSVFLFSFIIAAGDETYTLVYVNPASQTVSPSESFSISIYCSPDRPIKSYEFKISFDPSLLQANSVTEGTIFSGYTTFFSSGAINNLAGTIVNVYGLILGQGNVTGSGTIATISFTAKTSAGTSSLHLYDVGVTDETEYASITTDDGDVTIYSSDASIIFSEVAPDDGSSYEPISTSSLSTKIENLDGAPFDWIISTSPDIGSSYGNSDSNGTKSCNISGLDYDTTYTWYVSCKDVVSGVWTNESHWFETEEEPVQDGPPPSGGGGGGGTQTIVKSNNAPGTPTKPAGPSSIERGVVYEYSSYITDVDGDQVRFMFDWGDGVYSDWSEFVAANTTISLSRSWDSVSSYSIKVIAQDEGGANSTWSESLVVTISETENGTEDESLHLEIETPDETVSNETVFFDASSSYDTDGVIVSYEWDFGDGENGTGVNATHTYTTPGQYTVTLVVTDNEGNVYTKSFSVKVGSGAVGSDLEQEASGGEPLPVFTVISVCVFILIISLLVVFRDKINLFLLDRRLHLLKQGTSDEKDKLNKSIGRKKRIDYYSTVTNPDFSVKKKESSRDAPKKLQDHHLKKEKLLFDPNEIFGEEKHISRYDEFSVGDKIDKLVKTNLRQDPVDASVNDILDDIRREIDGFRDAADDDAEYLAVAKEVDALIRSKTNR